MRYLLFITLVISIVSCQSSEDKSNEIVPPSNFSNYEITVVKNDTIAKLPGKSTDYIEVGELSNGKRQGFWLYKRDTKRARPQSLKFYIDGQLNGPYLTYGANGYPEISTTYENGKIHGDFIEYSQGHPVEISHYTHGKLDGKQTLYYEEFKNRDKVRQTIEYEMGVVNGKMTWYNPDGEVTMEYIYKDGKKVSGGIVE